MANIKVICLCFLMAVSLHGTAQKSIDSFLTDVLSIKAFKLNTDLSDLKKNEKDNLFVFEKEDNSILVELKKASFDLLGLQSINMVNLIFKDNKLIYIDFAVLGNPANGIYEKTFENFKARYTAPVVSSVENNPFKKYTWTTRECKLILRPNMDRSFSIIFAKNIPEEKPLWIYDNRSGKGQGLMQLNLAYFEKLLNSNLTIYSFEKYLPPWKSEGVFNHIEYDYNSKTKSNDIPQFRIKYKLDNCEIEITTADTVAKIITDYKISKIDNTLIAATFKDDLKKMNYQIDPDTKSYIDNFYTNMKKNVSAILDKQSGFSIHMFKDK